MDINQILKTEHILLTSAAKTKDAVIEELAQALFRTGSITDKAQFMSDLYYRESLGFTGAGEQVAIPHAVSIAVNDVTVAIARTEHNIDWYCENAEANISSQNVRLVILFAIPTRDEAADDREYLKALGIIMGALLGEQNIEALLAAEDAYEVLEVLKNSQPEKGGEAIW